jgi:hypothetical protein
MLIPHGPPGLQSPPILSLYHSIFPVTLSSGVEELWSKNKLPSPSIFALWLYQSLSHSSLISEPHDRISAPCSRPHLAIAPTTTHARVMASGGDSVVARVDAYPWRRRGVGDGTALIASGGLPQRLPLVGTREWAAAQRRRHRRVV